MSERLVRLRRTGFGLVMMLALAACGGDADAVNDTGAVVTPSTTAPAVASERPTDLGAVDDVEMVPSTSAASSATAGGDAAAISPLADLVRPADDLAAPSELSATVGPAPVGLSIPDLGITDAGVRDVGVEPNGEMEIPGAREIGWYRWSASPGQIGSSVLAAHVAYNGSDGIFRNLRDLAVGAVFTVHYDDGTARDFRVTERAQYGKADLPFDRIFEKDGEPELVLITCGGSFNRGLNSYDDNVVAYATPI